MPKSRDLIDTIGNISAEKGLFASESYIFVLEALEIAMTDGEDRGHISGEDLLGFIRDLGRKRFGPMAGDVFNAWGVRETLDFGRIVFHLVEEGLLRKREEDSLLDFLEKFDFEEAFALKVFEGKG